VVVEETKSCNDNLFLNRKFPAVVTAIVSAAAVLLFLRSDARRLSGQKA
jgi:hypothetical protein